MRSQAMPLIINNSVIETYINASKIAAIVTSVVMDFSNNWNVSFGTTWRRSYLPKATITRCDLSPRFFCIDATLLCEFESDKISINEFE